MTAIQFASPAVASAQTSLLPSGGLNSLLPSEVLVPLDLISISIDKSPVPRTQDAVFSVTNISTQNIYINEAHPFIIYQGDTPVWWVDETIHAMIYVRAPGDSMTLIWHRSEMTGLPAGEYNIRVKYYDYVDPSMVWPNPPLLSAPFYFSIRT